MIAEGTRAQAAGPDVGMGFGPGSLEPVNIGTPIYVIGDLVWVESYYSHEVIAELESPSGVMEAESTLQPGLPVAMHTFVLNDTPGTWQLVILDDGATVSQPFRMETSNVSLVPSLLSSSLLNGELIQEFSLPNTDTTDIEACTLGASPSQFVRVAVPSSLASQMQFRLLNGVAIASFGQVRTPFTTWIELYSQYSFQISRTIATKDLQVGRTSAQAAVVGSSGSLNESVVQVLPFRDGRYTMRTYFRTASGLVVTENRLLLQLGTNRLSLGECQSLVTVESQTFTVETDLRQPASDWPVKLLMMFSSGGVEGSSKVPLPGVASAVDLVSAVANASLYGLEARASGQHLQDSEQSGNSLYLVSDHYPLNIKVDLIFGNVTSRTVSATVSSPNTRNPILLDSGIMTATATMQSRLDSNATFRVAAVGEQATLLRPNLAGNLKILLPPGDYTVTAMDEGRTASTAFELKSGGVENVVLEVGTEQLPLVSYGLMAGALLGVAANVLIWRRFLRARNQT